MAIGAALLLEFGCLRWLDDLVQPAELWALRCWLRFGDRKSWKNCPQTEETKGHWNLNLDGFAVLGLFGPLMLKPFRSGFNDHCRPIVHRTLLVSQCQAHGVASLLHGDACWLFALQAPLGIFLVVAFNLIKLVGGRKTHTHEVNSQANLQIDRKLTYIFLFCTCSVFFQLVDLLSFQGFRDWCINL